MSNTVSRPESVTALEISLLLSRLGLQGDDDSGRMQAMEALGLVIEHLTQDGVGGDALASLERLMESLLRVEGGGHAPMFKSDTTGGRPPRTPGQEYPRVVGAVALELLIKAGVSKGDAAAKVHLALLGWGVDLPTKGDTFSPTTVVNWRHQISSGDKIKDQPTRSYYRLLKRCDNRDPHQCVEDLLKRPHPSLSPRKLIHPP